jgi:hypothetical protein
MSLITEEKKIPAGMPTGIGGLPEGGGGRAGGFAIEYK